jgi:hypothetical protein
MKNISDLDTDAIRALQVGERVVSRSTRAPQFVQSMFEQSVCVQHADGTMSVSFLTVDQSEVAFHMTVRKPDGENILFDIDAPSVQPRLVELAQMRATPANLADLAAGIIEHMVARAPDVLVSRRERIESVLKVLPK